ncbi:MAG: stage III sporulation protein AE [Clostridia bacterium]|nr:stage III sporulation protein AE [Clostridia bacterium]
MKKIILTLLFIAFAFSLFLSTAKAEEISSESVDEAIENVLQGINEEDFLYLTNYLNEIFQDNLSFKERILSFLTGDFSIDFSLITTFLKGGLLSIFNDALSIASLVIFIGISYTVINIINYKKRDNSANNAIYFICYSIVIILFVNLINKCVKVSFDFTKNVNKVIEISFPIMITLGEFSGGFGVALYKPITYFATFLSSELITNFFMPIISVCFITVIVGNISDTLKLSSLNKTLLSLIKWVLGIITTVFSLVITAQGIVNSQYNGLSFKVLKYATGSMIPIVGNFISGGLDVLFSTSILVKNSIGVIAVVCLLFITLKAGFTILITAFVLKFAISLSESVLDDKFIRLSGGVCEVLSVLTAVLFAIGFIFLLTIFSFINSTALIF